MTKDLAAIKDQWTKFLREHLSERRKVHTEQNRNRGGKLSIDGNRWDRYLKGAANAPVYPEVLLEMAADAQITPSDPLYKPLLELGIQFIKANGGSDWAMAQEDLESVREDWESNGISFDAPTPVEATATDKPSSRADRIPKKGSGRESGR